MDFSHKSGKSGTVTVYKKNEITKYSTFRIIKPHKLLGQVSGSIKACFLLYFIMEQFHEPFPDIPSYCRGSTLYSFSSDDYKWKEVKIIFSAFRILIAMSSFLKLLKLPSANSVFFWCSAATFPVWTKGHRRVKKKYMNLFRVRMFIWPFISLT